MEFKLNFDGLKGFCDGKSLQANSFMVITSNTC